MAQSGGQVEPSSTERLRRQNVSLVLRSLRREGPATRTELSHRTGLAKATVGVIVAELERARAVLEEESRAGARGRPGRPVALHGDRFVALGLEINVDYVAVVVLDLAGDTRLVEIRPTPLDVLRREQALLDLVEQAVLPAVAGRVLVGATLAVPGLVRGDDRTVAWAPNVPLRGDSLVRRLERLLGGRCRIRVSNDANCAAYAETHHGAATDSPHVLYLTGTVGIGAGIVEDGELVRGATGFAGEVGHMPVGDPDAQCGCGRRGCWEASIGLHAMLEEVGMTELATPLDTSRAVATRALTDVAVRSGLARIGRDVGLGIAVLTQVLDPGVVVLGGYFVPLGDLVLGPARRTLDERLVSEVQHRPELRPGALGIQAAALGAAEWSFGDLLAGELDLSA
ncbi:ROK family protein [Nocardioides dilutus]